MKKETQTMTTIRVLAAVVDTRQLTLYLEDGTAVTVNQGDPRLKPILEEITPILANNEVAEITLAPLTNTYEEFQNESNGFVRFFKVAKKAVASFFGIEEERPQPQIVGNLSKFAAAVDEIIRHAEPANSKTFADALTDQETVIAVVEGEQQVVIPGMENLKEQFAYALRMGSLKGVQNFMKRLAKVIQERRHSVHDLLRFMERGDLPIADDGSIIIYKVLASGDDGRYVDCHSRNVSQFVGSYVCMDANMVDPNRRNECSNGLHVARRGYLRSFGGDICVLAKVAPEDVIAVPQHDGDKMRVCGYHILFELPQEAFAELKENKPMTSNSHAATLLSRAIAGDHHNPVERVHIGGHRGTNVTITDLRSGKVKQTKAKELPKAAALDDKETIPAVDPKKVHKDVAKLKAAAKKAPAPKVTAPVRINKTTGKPNPKTTDKQDARTMFETLNWSALIAFKKKKKKGWSALGFTEKEIAKIIKNGG